MKRKLSAGAVVAMLGVMALLATGQATQETKGVAEELLKPRFQVRRVLDKDDAGQSVTVPGKDDLTGADWRLGKEVLLDGRDVTDARVAPDPNTGRMTVAFTLNDKGREKFGQATQANLKKRLAMLIDGKVVMAPIIQSAITGGKGMITFGTDHDALKEAQDAAGAMRADLAPATTRAGQEKKE